MRFPGASLLALACLAAAGCGGRAAALRGPEPPRPLLGEATRPALPAERLGEARAALARGEYARAAEAARAARALNPSLAEAWRVEARARQALGDPAGSLEAWDRVISLHGGDPEAFWAYATLAVGLGRAEQARARLREALGAGPPAPGPAAALGWLALRTGRPGEARRLLEAVWAGAEAGRYAALVGRARLLAGDRAGAAVAADRAVEARPRDPAGWTLRGDVARARGLLAAARADYERALAIDPGHYPALVNLGVIHLDQGDLGRAEARFRRAAEVRPGRPEAWNDLGLVLRSQGRFRDARDAYLRALEADPAFAPALRNLGICLEKYLGDVDRAVEAYRRYLELRPGDPEVPRWIRAAARRKEGKR